MKLLKFKLTTLLEKHLGIHVKYLTLKSLHVLAFVSVAVLIGGCASEPYSQPQWSEAAASQQTSTGVKIAPTSGIPTTPSIEYIRVRMTDSVFLDPPDVDNPGVFLRVRNTTGRDDLYLHEAVADRIQSLRYRLVDNARDAFYIVQANVLFADELSAAELAKLDETEFGTDVGSIVTGVAMGAVSGALAGSAIDSTNDSAAVGAAAGAIIGGLAADYKDRQRKRRLEAKQLIKFFSIVVDIQLRERTTGIVQITGSSDAAVARPSVEGAFEETSSYSRQESQTISEHSQWKRYQTRIIGKAKGKLVVFEDIQNEFVDKLASSLAGVL